MLNFKDFLNEISFNINSTEYIKRNIKYHGRDVLEYRFTANSEERYSVYFMITTEEDFLLPNKKMLSDFTDLNEIPTIFFSLSDRPFDETFNHLTNKKEFLEVMGKVVFLIREYMDKHNYTVYTYETDNKKNNFYNYYMKYFSEFILIGHSSINYYDGDSRKQISYLIKDYRKFMFENQYWDFGTHRFKLW